MIDENIDIDKFTERNIRKLLRLEKARVSSEPAKRLCLRCEKVFMSLSKENRICYNCKSKNVDVIEINGTY
jgi:Zn finger protein HypA/HybF involved in hydrogenase expression